MSGRIWPLSGIRAACPRCKAELTDAGGAWVCGSCPASYEPAGGGPHRLTADDSRESERKEAVKQMFTAMHRTLEANGLSRFSTFVNWGYAAPEERAGRQPHMHTVHGSSVRLLREALGDTRVDGQDVLEVACGRGGNVAALCAAYEPRSVVGVDLTEVNVLFCHGRNRRDNVYFCVGDAERLPIGTACCDIVLTVEAADLFPNVDRFYDEVYRVLKPGGIFVFADDLPLAKFEASERYLRSLGFDTVFERDITENVLLSSDLSSARRYAALRQGGAAANGAGAGEASAAGADAMLDTIGLPGTSIYDEMREGRRKYKAMRLVKR